MRSEKEVGKIRQQKIGGEGREAWSGKNRTLSAPISNSASLGSFGFDSISLSSSLKNSAPTTGNETGTGSRELPVVKQADRTDGR